MKYEIKLIEERLDNLESYIEGLKGEDPSSHNAASKAPSRVACLEKLRESESRELEDLRENVHRLASRCADLESDKERIFREMVKVKGERRELIDTVTELRTLLADVEAVIARWGSEGQPRTSDEH